MNYQKKKLIKKLYKFLKKHTNQLKTLLHLLLKLSMINF